MDIMTYIPMGKENAIPRQTLVFLLGLQDRQVRKLIQEARDRGEIILNDQSGAGYYTSDNLEELERQYRANRNRALSILRQQKHIRRKVREIRTADQITFEEGWRLMAAEAGLTLAMLEATRDMEEQHEAAVQTSVL